MVMNPLLVIFDLDGTLVDSETLCCQAFLDLVPALSDPVDVVVDRYRGKKLAVILRDIESRIGARLAENFEQLYRQHVAERFASDLKPIPEVPEMLGALQHPFCIASSGPLEKITHALAVTGLAPLFGHRIFSSYVVGSWKPDPGLFLHAAKAMGFAPEHCVVVEDSPVGLEAAAAAGMRALHYAPHGTAQVSDNTFSTMSALPALLQGIANAHAITDRDTPSTARSP
nr:HAD-IA family hydrolase [uncultured Rhodoferax sp.]